MALVSRKCFKSLRGLAKLIDKDDKKVTERDKKDYWITTNPKEAEEKVPEKERKAYRKSMKNGRIRR